MTNQAPPAPENDHSEPSPNILRTPDEWCALHHVTVVDPDGWRGSRTLPAKSWDEPISHAEWTERLAVSTQSAIATAPAVPEDEGQELDVVDRVALRLMRTQIYGTLREQRWDDGARRRWAKLDGDERDEYRRVARDLVADVHRGEPEASTACQQTTLATPTDVRVGCPAGFSSECSYWTTNDVCRCNTIDYQHGQQAILIRAHRKEIQHLQTEIERLNARLDELGANQTEHVIDIQPDGWTIKHPLSCRPELFDCPVNQAARRRDFATLHPKPGRYNLALNDDGWIVISEQVEA